MYSPAPLSMAREAMSPASSSNTPPSVPRFREAIVAVVAAPWLPGKGNLVLAVLLGSGIGTALEAWWTPTR